MPRKGREGGAFLGKGTYGCAFVPNITCEGSKSQTPNAIGKVFFENRAAKAEKAISKVMFNIDPSGHWFRYPKEQCIVKKETIVKEDVEKKCENVLKNPQEKFGQLLMENGGQRIHEFLDNYDDMPRATLLKFMKRMFDGVGAMVHNKQVHQDIKLDNVVAHAKTKGIVRIIDFGWLRSFADFYKPEKNRMMAVKRNYAPSGPEYRVANSPASQLKADIVREELLFTKTIPGYNKLMYFDAPRSLEKLVDDLTEFDEHSDRMKLLKKWNTAEKVDVYSCGIVLLKLASSFCIPERKDDPEVVETFNDILRDCLMPHPNDRSSIREILRAIKSVKLPTQSSPSPSPSPTQSQSAKVTKTRTRSRTKKAVHATL